jgi:ketosteroid isomerase-like protein
MGVKSPAETVSNLMAAINKGDLDAAVRLYEPDAVIVAQPGNIARGMDAVRAALAGFIALKPALKSEAHQVVEAGIIALSGASSDVLRRQPDGRWLVAIDNPWGTAIV